VLEVVGYDLNDKEDVLDNVSEKKMPNANSPAEDLAMIRLLTGILLDCGEEWKQSSSYESWKVMFELKKSKMGCNHLCRKIL